MTKPKRSRKRIPKEVAFQNLSLWDDRLFRTAIQNNPALAKAILVPILGRKDFKVTDVQTQVHADSMDRHGVVFDCVITFHNGTQVDLEMQKQDEGANAMRISYYAARFMASRLGKSDDYRKLPNTIIVFLVRKDILHQGRPLYQIHRYAKGNDGNPLILFPDKQWIYVADMRYHDEQSELGRLMHDLGTPESERIYNPVLAEAMDDVKYRRKDNFMNRIVAQWERQCREDGREEGREEGKTETVLMLLREGTIDEAVALRVLGISPEELHRIAANQQI